MDFLDPKKKRAHRNRLYIGYFLMGLILALVSAILFFEAKGFDISRKTGEIIQNGMVFVAAHPEKAEIFVNGEKKGTTNTRMSIPAGDYTFKLTRRDYRNWQKSFYLEGSKVERLDYAFLFPEKLNSVDIAEYQTGPSFATQSPDRKWLIVLRPETAETFDVYDLSNQKNPTKTSFELPEGLLANNKQGDRLELIEWSNDNRHFLIKHSNDESDEFIIIDIKDPLQSININKLFDIPIYKMTFSDKKYDKYHILESPGGILRYAEAKTKQTLVLAPQVYSYKTYGNDVIFYVSKKPNSSNRVNAQIIKGNKRYKVRELEAGNNYPINISRYDNKWYMAVGSDKDGKAYIYNDVLKDVSADPAIKPAPLAIFKLNNLTDISVSANTRFIGVQGGSKFAVYDAEHDRRHQFDTKMKFTEGQKATWMDGHRLTAVIDGKLHVWDYDGENMQALVSVYPSFIPFFDRDYDFLYTLSPGIKDAQKPTLLKTPMRTPADL